MVLLNTLKFLIFTGYSNFRIMYRRVFSILMILLLAIIVISCSNTKVSQKKQSELKEESTTQKTKTGPRAIIYKTKADYFNYVPVTLTDDKSAITSFPGIKDIYYKGELAYPTKLNNDFLLDNRGIDNNVAFLKYTYEQYAALKETPTSEDLFNNILEDDPITEMYNCGSKFDYKNLVDELNEAIANNKLASFQKLK